jgi:hypothetical protein
VVEPGRLPYPIALVDGPGYDGQFFFKTALDLSGAEYKDAIQYDAPSYRNQRILYPLLAWLLALGQPGLIPITLIAVNCAAMLGLWALMHTVCAKNGIDPLYSALPLLYNGLHMAVGRDLAEPMEMLLVLSVFLVVPMQKPLLLASLSALAFFTKDTTIIYILPVAVYFTIKYAPRKLPGFISFALIMGLPYVLFLAWKLYLNSYYAETDLVQGTHDFSLPFQGLVSGFALYFEQSSLMNTAAFLIAALQFAWLIWLIVLVFPHFKKAISQRFREHYAELVWALWLILSIFFSRSIFMDDWGFVRIFTAFTGISFFILYTNGQKPGRWFIVFSIVLYAIMTARLWLRA